MYKLILSIVIILVSLLGYFFWNSREQAIPENLEQISEQVIDEGEADPNPHALSIEALRAGDYPGSDIVIEQTLTPGSNYQRYIASYKSEGLKIYALLTVPSGKSPPEGFPVIIFNHGYIQPAHYRTAEKYVSYTDAFSRNGYVVLMPDFRGHGNSEGEASGGYGSNGYTIDVLNAVASVKNYPEVNGDKIGMWGHSMGGHVTLRSMVASKDIKAGVIWAGVVGSYSDLLNNWRRGNFSPPPMPSGARRWRLQLTEQFGTPEQNPEFWNSISATSFLSDISGAVQLHHGTADRSVPLEFSKNLDKLLDAAGKESELFVYEGDDHNLSDNLSLALLRSVEFFDKYLK